MPDDIERLKLELDEANDLIRRQNLRIGGLHTELQDMRNKLEILQRERPRLSPESLTESFKFALLRMQEGLETTEGSVGYTINKFETDLKVAASLDEDGNLLFQLPKVEDVIPLDNLSNIRFSINTIPKHDVTLPSTIQVPNLIGMSRHVAERTIKESGFELGNITEKISTSSPGTVIDQIPEHYTRATAEDPIHLMLSKLRETEVPNLVHMNLDDAEEVIRAARLVVGKISKELSDRPMGTVIRQSIATGKTVLIETAIDLTTAEENTTIMPNVVNEKVREAQKIIEDVHLQVGKVAKRFSSLAPGIVLSQDPAAESKVEINSEVNLEVSKRGIHDMPNLVGMNLDEAKAYLGKAKLNVTRVVRRKSNKPKNIVIGQSPVPGIEVTPETPIRLTISTG